MLIEAGGNVWPLALSDSPQLPGNDLLLLFHPSDDPLESSKKMASSYNRDYK